MPIRFLQCDCRFEVKLPCIPFNSNTDVCSCPPSDESSLQFNVPSDGQYIFTISGKVENRPYGSGVLVRGPGGIFLYMIGGFGDSSQGSVAYNIYRLSLVFSGDKSVFGGSDRVFYLNPGTGNPQTPKVILYNISTYLPSGIWTATLYASSEDNRQLVNALLVPPDRIHYHGQLIRVSSSLFPVCSGVPTPAP